MWLTHRPVGEAEHERDSTTYKIQIRRVDETGLLRVYISAGARSDLLIEGVDISIKGETAGDMRHYGDDPIATLIEITKGEIDAGKVHLE